MTRDDIIRMALEADMMVSSDEWVFDEMLERFAALVAAAERNKVAQWMIGRSYATGHGDTVEDLLVQLEWQAREREREACAKVCEQAGIDGYGTLAAAVMIRAREKK